ncbi:MAG: DAK2 domain-containing protein [Candidatus Carbobacillus sp.]|nr:DAK2 domain-containing protein [Candidatus Carbobacillus sp.]
MNGVYDHGHEKEAIDGQTLLAAFEYALEVLKRKKQDVDALNVFPVPDGDTGTNMYLTFSSGVKEARAHADTHVGRVVKALSRGLLMGARGNSGVILSQLFRGFSLYLEHTSELTPDDFAYALKQGVETAYAAVIKPVEGTILTVAREAAHHTIQWVERNKKRHTFSKLLETWLEYAHTTLKRTPDMLPILKQAGVVDAGGFGLITIMEGLAQFLSDEDIRAHDQEGHGIKAAALPTASDSFLDEAHAALDLPVQVGMDPRDITYGYCTEFIVRLDPSMVTTFDEKRFRETMESFGDSLLVARDHDLVKLHVHTERPGEAMTYVQTFGEIIRIKIDNMREQLREVNRAYGEQQRKDDGGAETKTPENNEAHVPQTPGIADTAEAPSVYGFVAVVQGEGMRRIFESLGVRAVIYGGQTMNPSTEEILAAIEKLPDDTIFILPNNKNIILAAEQAKHLTGRTVEVIETTSMPEGIAALIAFNPDDDVQTNLQRMRRAAKDLKVAQFTQAVRDAQQEDQFIREGEWLGLYGGTIMSHADTLLEVVQNTLSQMIDKAHDSLLTLYWGETMAPDDQVRIVQMIEATYPELEIEVQEGGQPLYPLIISVE